jgi:hypothetical protein
MLNLKQKLLQLLVITFELLAFNCELITFRWAQALLRDATVLELTLAEQSQCDLENRLAKFVQIFRRKTVNCLPLKIDDAWVLDAQHIICHRQIQRELLVQLGCHCCLLIFLNCVELLHSRQETTLVGCLCSCTSVFLQAEVIKDELKLLWQPDIKSENLSTQIQHNVEDWCQSALLIASTRLLKLLHQAKVILFSLVGGSENHEAIFEEGLRVFFEEGLIWG